MCEQQSEDNEGILQGKTIKERYIAQGSGWIKPLTEIPVGIPEKA